MVVRPGIGLTEAILEGSLIGRKIGIFRVTESRLDFRGRWSGYVKNSFR